MKLFARLFLAFVLIASGQAWAAVAIVGTPTVIDDGGTYTAESGSNRVVVACLANRTSDTGSNITPTVTAFAVGGDTLANAQLISAVETAAGSGSNWRAGCWYVKEAQIDTGSMTIDVTWSDAMQSTTKIAMYTLSGVNQTTPIDTTITKAQSSATVWQQAVTVADNSLNVSAAVWGAGGTSATPDSGWTEVLDATGGGSVRAHSQYRAHVTGAAVTWGITLSSALSGRIAIASFAASASTPTFTSAPAIGTRTTSSIPINATSDTTGTMYGGRLTDGSATPTCDQLEAQTATGGVQYASEAVVATVADTLTFSSITSGVLSDGYFCVEDGSGNDSAVASIADMYKLPAFSAGPTFSSCSATGCTYSLTLDGPGTVYGVACKADSAAATVTQVEAAQCTGGVAAVASANKAVTGADTLVIGSALDFPIHDFAIVGVYGSQHEAAIHADNARIKSAPTGYSYQTLASVDAGTWYDVEVNAPDAAAGDVGEVSDPTAILGQDVTFLTDGNWSFSNSGARDRLCIRAYDRSVKDWMSITNPSASCAGTRAANWYNNQAPVFSPSSSDHVFSTGEAFTLDVCARATDAESDALTNAVTTGTLTTGLTVGGTGNCVVSGTVANGDEDEDGNAVVFTVTDIAGDTDEYTAAFYPLNTITIPDCTNVETATCEASLAAVFLNSEIVVTAYSSTIVAGRVISQSPAGGLEADPFDDTIELTVSLGSATGLNPLASIFRADGVPVDSSAVFKAGAAYAQDGSVYVTPYPATARVVFLRGLAYRQDGALTICTSSCTQAAYVRGIAVTTRGEVIAAACVPSYAVAGIPMQADGTVCMTNIN